MHCQILPIITFITTVACKEVNRGKMNTNYSNTTTDECTCLYTCKVHTPFSTCILKSIIYKHIIQCT